MTTSTYRVCDGTQLNLAGVLHPAGDVVDLDPITGDWALLAGVVTSETTKRKTAKDRSDD